MRTASSHRIQRSGVRPLSSALKIFRLLDHLGQLRDSAKLSEIAAEVGGGRASIYQRLITLVEAGWVEQTEDARFRLSMRPVQLAGAALDQASLGERTLPILRDLVEAVHETASLAVMHGLDPCIVQRVEDGGILHAALRLGSTMSLSDSASGRVLVAFAKPDDLRRWRAAGAMLPAETVLADVRRTGIGFSLEGIGVQAAAAPVFDRGGRCLAALSLVGPEGRFDPTALVAPLAAAARRITALLGGEDRSLRGPDPAPAKAPSEKVAA